MLAISMRMMHYAYPRGGEEIRDTLDQGWWQFLNQALPSIPAIPLPNIGKSVTSILQQLSVSGLILSGGDDWGVFPLRDVTETVLLDWATQRNLPVLGVCRGAQVLNQYMGGQTASGFGVRHAGTRHAIRLLSLDEQNGGTAEILQVNSYHNNGIQQKDLAASLIPRAVADDGSVEAFSSRDGRLAGIMWHPEREPAAQRHDIQIFQMLR